MATYLENLIAQREALAAKLATLPILPDSSIDGESIQWSAMRKGILDEMEALTKAIVIAQGPYEVRTRGLV